MWCGRQNCINREHFDTQVKHKGEGGGSDGDNDGAKFTKNFKMSLAAMTSPADYKLL